MRSPFGKVFDSGCCQASQSWTQKVVGKSFWLFMHPLVLFPPPKIQVGESSSWKLIPFPEIAEGNEEIAVDRHESLTQLALSCLATMVNIPLEMDNGADGRRKVVALIHSCKKEI